MRTLLGLSILAFLVFIPTYWGYHRLQLRRAARLCEQRPPEYTDAVQAAEYALRLEEQPPSTPFPGARDQLFRICDHAMKAYAKGQSDPDWERAASWTDQAVTRHCPGAEQLRTELRDKMVSYASDNRKPGCYGNAVDTLAKLRVLFNLEELSPIAGRLDRLEADARLEYAADLLNEQHFEEAVEQLKAIERLPVSQPQRDDAARLILASVQNAVEDALRAQQHRAAFRRLTDSVNAFADRPDISGQLRAFELACEARVFGRTLPNRRVEQNCYQFGPPEDEPQMAVLTLTNHTGQPITFLLRGATDISVALPNNAPRRLILNPGPHVMAVISSVQSGLRPLRGDFSTSPGTSYACTYVPGEGGIVGELE
jgi:hypothetical protein